MFTLDAGGAYAVQERGGNICIQMFMRVVPLATLLAVDQTLSAVIELKVGEALRRDGEKGEWERWGSSELPECDS